MALPTPPADAIALLAALNGNPYDSGSNPYGLAQGGHRQNFPPGVNAVATVANYLDLLGIEVEAKAEQVEADAASAAAGSGTEATVPNIRAGLTAQYLSIRNTYAANVPVVLTDGASIAWDMSAGINFELTLGAAGRSLENPSNQVAGKSGLLLVAQDATGGRSITTWGSNFRWVGGTPFWPSAGSGLSLVTYFVWTPGLILLTFGGSTT